MRNAFNQGDELEIIPFSGDVIKVRATEIMDLTMKAITRTRPTTLVRVPYVKGVESMHLIRQRVKV